MIKIYLQFSGHQKIPAKLSNGQEEYLRILLKQIHIFGIAGMVYGLQVHL